MSPVDDLDALIARAQNGEARAFEILIASQLGQVRRFALAFTPSLPDADDLAQEALLKVYKSLRQFRYQSAFSTWLFTVVRSVFLDFAKSRAGLERSREEPLEARHTSDLPGAAPADELMEQEQERRRVWRALRRVPVEFRTALVLFDLEGRPYDEVAAIERVPVGTVKSRLFRGRGHLRHLLGEAGGEPSPASPPGSGESSESLNSPESPGSDTEPGTSPGRTSSHMRRSGS